MFLGNKMQKYRPKEAVGKLLKKILTTDGADGREVFLFLSLHLHSTI